MPSANDEAHLRNTSTLPTVHPDNAAGAPQPIVAALQQAWIAHRAANLKPVVGVDHGESLTLDGHTNYEPPHFLANLRHNCPAQRHVSKALDLKEVYITLDPTWIEAIDYEARDRAQEAAHPEPTVSAADFALLCKLGTCKKCKLTAASPTGRVVKRDVRPPIAGRVGR